MIALYNWNNNVSVVLREGAGRQAGWAMKRLFDGFYGFIVKKVHSNGMILFRCDSRYKGY